MWAIPRLSDARCADEFLSLAIAREAKACESEKHHRPGRGLGDNPYGQIDEADVVVGQG